MEYAKKREARSGCELWGEEAPFPRIPPPSSITLQYAAEVRELENALDYTGRRTGAHKPDDKITSAIERVSEAIKRRRPLKNK